MTNPARMRRIRIVWGALFAFAVTVAVLPTVSSPTGLCNWLLRRALGGGRLQVTVEHASLGWVTPLRLSKLTAVDQQQKLTLHIEQVAAQPWPKLWWSFPDLGELRFERPRCDMVATSGSSLSELLPPRRRRQPTLQGIVEQAEFRVRPAVGAAPVIQVDGLDLKFRIAETARGRTLQLEPTELLRQEPLTPEVFQRGLQLVAPILAHSAAFVGSVSLRLDECRVSLDSPPDAKESGSRLSGVLTFHSVSAGLKNPLLLQLTAVVSRLLQRELPTRMKIVENSEVLFRLEQGAHPSRRADIRPARTLGGLGGGLYGIGGAGRDN